MTLPNFGLSSQLYALFIWLNEQRRQIAQRSFANCVGGSQLGSTPAFRLSVFTTAQAVTGSNCLEITLGITSIPHLDCSAGRHLVKHFEIIEHEEGRQHDDPRHGLDSVDKACVICALQRKQRHHILWTQQL